LKTFAVLNLAVLGSETRLENRAVFVKHYSYNKLFYGGEGDILICNPLTVIGYKDFQYLDNSRNNK
jgi:hypothetical protein